LCQFSPCLQNSQLAVYSTFSCSCNGPSNAPGSPTVLAWGVRPGQWNPVWLWLLSISGCCAFCCAARYYGQFLWLERSGPTCNLSTSTFVLCGIDYTNADNVGDSGGIEVDTAFSTVGSDLNFTDSRVTGQGAAILVCDGSRELRLTRVTVLRCRGQSIIESTRTSSPTISFCNFYECTVTTRWEIGRASCRERV
jgi:hypothetical protein